jgi:hypothetical protein
MSSDRLQCSGRVKKNCTVKCEEENFRLTGPSIRNVAKPLLQDSVAVFAWRDGGTPETNVQSVSVSKI